MWDVDNELQNVKTEPLLLKYQSNAQWKFHKNYSVLKFNWRTCWVKILSSLLLSGYKLKSSLGSTVFEKLEIRWNNTRRKLIHGWKLLCC